MTPHRRTLQALGGLLLALFISTLSGTVVTTALPKIVGGMHGSQTTSTWVIAALLLTTTASTPIWGKLADLFDKKRLVQTAIVVFAAGSLLAGASQNVPELIAGRAIQGVGGGGLQALVQICIGTMISPRERGRYAGYQSSATALATIGGPLLGGLMVDTPGLGWRWCFFISLPIAALALVILQATLDLPVLRRGDVKIDYLGATLISGGVSLLLIWVSFVDASFAWSSWQTAAMVGGSVLILGAAIYVESRVDEPLVPLQIIRQRPVALAILGSLAAGTAMYGASVFLSQYFQLARSRNPTEAGLLTIPMMVGILAASLIGGRLLSRVGRIKPFLITGTVLLTAGFVGLSRINHTTPIPFIAVSMVLVGAGVGMTAQNFTLLVQNSVQLKDLGASTSSVTFFRSLGGTIGVTVLGALLARGVSGQISSKVGAAGLAPVPTGHPAALLTQPGVPSAVQEIVRNAYGDVTGHIFIVSAVVALVGVFAVLAMKPANLRTTLDLSDPAEGAAAGVDPLTGAGAVSAVQADAGLVLAHIRPATGDAAEVVATSSSPDR